MNEQNTATPWRYDEELRATMSSIRNDEHILCAIPNETWDEGALAKQRVNATFIVTACNAHGALVAIRGRHNALARASNFSECGCDYCTALKLAEVAP